MEKSAFDLIYDTVRQIPEGKVASYGQIAELAGNRRWARVVGYALHAVPEGSGIPWHRVVKKDGEVFGGAFRGERAKRYGGGGAAIEFQAQKRVPDRSFIPQWRGAEQSAVQLPQGVFRAGPRDSGVTGRTSARTVQDLFTEWTFRRIQ